MEVVFMASLCAQAKGINYGVSLREVRGSSLHVRVGASQR